jgi:hypothetical protein
LVPSFSFLMVSWLIKFLVAPLSTSTISSAVPLNDNKEIGISSWLSLLNIYIVLRHRPLAMAANWNLRQNPLQQVHQRISASHLYLSVRQAFTSLRMSETPFLVSFTASVMPERVCWVEASLLYSADPFCLVGQYLDMCPFPWHLKQLPVSWSFCFSSSVRMVKQGQLAMFPASTSIVLGSRWHWFWFWGMQTPSCLAMARA